MKINKILCLEGTLKCETGLHIGGSETLMKIGGIDNPVIKNPVNGYPYIPGSSLKGKIRSLLEWKSGFVQEKPLSWSDYVKTESEEILKIIQLFGMGGSESLSLAQAEKVGLSRLSFWDCPIDEEWVKKIQEANGLLTEVKTENGISRITGQANPRQSERVLAGTPFKFRVTIKILDTDKEAELLGILFQGLKLLENDSLGGSGSRGYGKIKIENLLLDGKPVQKEFDAADPFAL